MVRSLSRNLMSLTTLRVLEPESSRDGDSCKLRNGAVIIGLSNNGVMFELIRWPSSSVNSVEDILHFWLRIELNY